jgi:hypothetical protein
MWFLPEVVPNNPPLAAGTNFRENEFIRYRQKDEAMLNFLPGADPNNPPVSAGAEYVMHTMNKENIDKLKYR